VAMSHRAQMRHVVMPVDLLEAAIFMPEVASFAVEAEPFTVECPAVLALEFVIHALNAIVAGVSLAVVVCNKLVNTVRVLAFVAISTEASLIPVLAHLALIHRPLNEGLPSEAAARTEIVLLFDAGS